jgi:hypothetical protein
MRSNRVLFLACAGIAAIAACSSDSSNGTAADGGGSGSGSGAGSSGSSSGAGGSSSGGSSSGSGADDAGGGGSQGIACQGNGKMCAMPNACCQPLGTGHAANATTLQVCIVACDDATQEQLCANDNDCQASATRTTCYTGICTDPTMIGGDGGGMPDTGSGVIDGGGKGEGGTGKGDAGAGRPKDAGRG